jgi:metal transporter CNNM
MDYLIVVVLVLFSGLFSGLTLGLLGLDKAELKRKIGLGNKDAKKVYSVRKRGNLLLCTLLLGNVAVNSTLAIFLGNIASGVMAGLVATGLIVIFGEIIPQATFSRYALQFGSKTAWLVKIFIFVLFPICFPIAWILDKVLGEEMNTIYSKKELVKIVEEHENATESEVDEVEHRIVKGALSFSDKSAEQIMTPRTVVYSLEINDILDANLLDEIREEGFTRIPLYDESVDNVVGVLYSKDLIGIKPGTAVSSLSKKRELLKISLDTKLDDVLNLFLKSKTHLALVLDEYGGLDGIVTLEDVIEEVFAIEILDETDDVADMQKYAKEHNPMKSNIKKEDENK